jgi:hypothetical protein
LDFSAGSEGQGEEDREAAGAVHLELELETVLGLADGDPYGELLGIGPRTLGLALLGAPLAGAYVLGAERVVVELAL